MITFIIFILSLNYAQTEKEHIAVIDLTGEITESESIALTNKVINEMLRTGKYSVFERSQMEEILKEQGFQQSGCTNEECAIEIGQLLGVRNIVFGNIGKVGKMYSISLKMVNVETGEIEKSTSLDFKGTIEDILTKGIIQAVQQLMEKSKPSLTLAEQVTRRRTALKTTFAIISAAVGIGSGAASVYFWSEKANYYDKYKNSPSQPQIDEYYSKGNDAYTYAGIFTGVSAVCIPTSIILFVLRTKGKKKPDVSINTHIGPGIGILSFSYAF